MVAVTQLQLELEYKEMSLEFHKLALSEFQKIGREEFNSSRLDYYLDIADMFLECAKELTLQRIKVSAWRKNTKQIEDIER